MPRRLGTDPLARAKAASASGAQRAAGNGVFFQMRGLDADPGPIIVNVPAPETSEITEISEIPEIKEAVAATMAPEAAPQAPAEATAPASYIQEVVSNLAAPAENAAPAAPAAPEGPSEVGGDAEKDGLLKRLFGLGK